MKYLLWDIDGTLLLTNFAGVTALQETIKEIYGIENFTFSHSLAGRTDTFIAKQAITEIKGSATKEEVTKLLKLYATKLPTTLKLKEGHLLPHIEKLLKELDGSKEVMNLLLTGNCEPGAVAKLKHFKLDQYFDFKLSAFGEISELRAELSKAALKKIQAFDPKARPEDVLIIGDTPQDITCAQAIEAKSLIVEVGSTYSTEELDSYHPWKIIGELPETETEFLDLIKD